MSENYRALTRKYRPVHFEDIVAQEHISNTLINAIKNNRLSHAYLFCGPRGVGKTTMARVLARAINNISDDIDSEVLSNTMDIIEIDGASNRKLEDAHRIRDVVRVPPSNSQYKVIIIDEVHMLTKEAFNALLKTLEEPPKYLIFVFATTEPHKVLPTILSRCQRFDFRRIQVDEIVSRLKFICATEEITIDDESLHLIARRADGALRDALGLMDQAIAFCGTTITYQELKKALNAIGTDRMFELMEFVGRKDADGGLSMLSEIIQEGYDLQEFLIELTQHLRNLFVAKAESNITLIEATEETRQRYVVDSQKYSRDDLMRMIHIVSEAQYRIRDAHQPKITFEIAILKLIQMERSGGMEELMGELMALKKFLVSKGSELPDFGSLKSAIASSAQTSVPAEKPYVKKQDVGRVSEGNATAKPAQTAPPEKKEEQPAPKPAPVKKIEKEPEPENLELTPPPPSAPSPRIVTDSSGEEKEIIRDPNQRPLFDDGLFGAPALKNRTQNMLPSLVSDSEEESQYGRASTEGSAALSLAISPQVVTKTYPATLSGLQEGWAYLAESFAGEQSSILSQTLLRCEPVSINDGSVTLKCQDAFVERLIQDHKREILIQMRDIYGRTFSLNLEISKAEAPVEFLDNFTRFEKLKASNPKIRALVEILGAAPEH